ncbi:MAG: VTT domain-containing protein [Pseudorhodobacter sp.]|nr:VTT domain-containing protein [Pseudorhodobacter sp.]
MIESGPLAALIAENGLLVLALLCLVEGPAATLAGGWLASIGLLPLGGVLLVAVLGEIVGDLLHYLAGRLVMPWLPVRWRNRVGLSDQRMHRLDAHFARHGGGTVLLGKCTHALGAVVLVAAGAARMPPLRLLFWATIAGVPKVFLLTGLGWQLGLSVPVTTASAFWWSMLISALVLFALLMMRRARKRGLSI